MSLTAFLVSLRPTQWVKNLFVFAAVFFAREFFDPALLLRTVFAFLLFCALSGSLYIFNDLRDLEEDRWHPRKSRRPIASGRLNPRAALVAAIVLSVVGLELSYLLDWKFFLVILSYFLMQLAYSLQLKHVPILDVFIIAAGFVLRVVAGGVVIQVALSDWILICTTLLALFISLSKRRHELVLLEDKADRHRPILKEYSAVLLDQMVSVVTASTLIAYCLYTVSAETVAKFGTKNLIFTTPFVLYGIFRYLYLIHQKGQGGSPEELVIRDAPLLIDILLWVVSAAAILYFF